MATTTDSQQPIARRPIVAKCAIALSWLAMSAAGTWLFMSTVAPIERGRSAAALFVVIMAVVHSLGYLKYQGQFRADRQRSDPLLEKYLPALKATAIQQGLIVLLASLMLDMGQAMHIASMAVLAYWMMFALIAARRLESPTRVDLHAVRWGFLYIWFVVGIAAPLWWQHVGRTY